MLWLDTKYFQAKCSSFTCKLFSSFLSPQFVTGVSNHTKRRRPKMEFPPRCITDKKKYPKISRLSTQYVPRHENQNLGRILILLFFLHISLLSASFSSLKNVRYIYITKQSVLWKSTFQNEIFACASGLKIISIFVLTLN